MGKWGAEKRKLLKISVKYLNIWTNIFIEFNWQDTAIKDNEIKYNISKINKR